MKSYQAQITRLLRNHFSRFTEIRYQVSYLDEVLKAGGNIYTHIDNGEVLAYVILENSSESMVDVDSPKMPVTGLCLAYMGCKKGHRRKGLVRPLVQKAKARAVLENRPLNAYTAGWNTRSINLLTSEGFKVQKVGKQWVYFSFDPR